MRDRRHSPSNIERLRLAIDCMPVATREAMLAGVRAAERVIVGAYVDRDGGVCPMLAAHRAGGRTNLLSFARAWDRFARAGRRSRAATERELRILVCQLEASLQAAEDLALEAAIGEHRALVGRRRTVEARETRRRAREPRRRMRWARHTQGPPCELPDEADPRGEIVACCLTRPSRPSRVSRPGRISRPSRLSDPRPSLAAAHPASGR